MAAYATDGQRHDTNRRGGESACAEPAPRNDAVPGRIALRLDRPARRRTETERAADPRPEMMRRQTPNSREEVLRYNCSNAALSPLAVATSRWPGSSWSRGFRAGMTDMHRPVALKVREVPDPGASGVVPISFVITQA